MGVTNLARPAVPGVAESDEQLAASVRSGDDGALARVFQRHAASIHRLAWRITGTREDADDVVQDVFLGLRSALQRYKERESLDGWLRRVAARRALMLLRTTSRNAARESAAAAAPPSAREDERLVAQLALRDAVATLPEPLRQVFVLGDVEGFSHAEIAELLGITPMASRTRRYRAVALLQTALRTSR